MSAIAVDPAPGRGVVLYDSDCAFCRKGVSIVSKLDWLNRLHYQSARDAESFPPSGVPLVQEKMLEEMHLLRPDRQKTYVGFRAFRWMSWRLPLTLPIAPLLYIPGVPWLGDRIYKWVARNRFKLIPCRDGACQVPLRK